MAYPQRQRHIVKQKTGPDDPILEETLQEALKQVSSDDVIASADELAERRARLFLGLETDSAKLASIAAHGHADALSICLALDGEWWLVDPGTYAYHSEQGWRDYFRGTAPHNTVEVDGVNQSEIGGPFLWVKHALSRLVDVGTDPEGVQWATGVHDGYERLGVTHTRRIELSMQDSIITVPMISEEMEIMR